MARPRPAEFGLHRARAFMIDVTQQLPLSAAQHGIWLGQQLDRSNAVYGTAECIALPLGADRALLARAVAQALSEADVLHVRYEEHEGVPRQRLVASREVDLAWVELDPGCDALTEVRRFAALDLSRPFDLVTGPVFRSTIFCAGPALYWYLAAHHIALDGFGFVLIVQRAADIYTALYGDVAPKPRWFGALQSVLSED
ncbi:MAG TPA: condensation domain-containing protein, partial [Polyangiaceae bacterium]|nr:condensation domain-containing protein [Polyangiaceae bacterium]